MGDFNDHPLLSISFPFSSNQSHRHLDNDLNDKVGVLEVVRLTNSTEDDIKMKMLLFNMKMIMMIMPDEFCFGNMKHFVAK